MSRIRAAHRALPSSVLPMLLLGASLPALAASSRVTEVQVYPGGASILRVARVASGSQQIQLNCLSQNFDPDSLQIEASAGIAVGEASIESQPRESVPECANTPLDQRIRELEAQQAQTGAEREALDLALAYYKNLGPDTRAAAGAQALQQAADAIQRGATERLQKRLLLSRQLDDLDKQLAPLRAERERQFGNHAMQRSLRLSLSAEKDGELRVHYRSGQAGWTPIYRAYLDTRQGQLRLERHAQVSQQSGEDWSGVKLRLSTEQPRLATGLPGPQSWTLDIAPPPNNEMSALRAKAMAMPAPAAMTLARSAPAADAAPSFDISIFQGEYAAEFEVPGLVTVQTGPQHVSFVLGQQPLDGQLLSRVQPQQDEQAYLLVQTQRPAGSWPRGPLQLYRDGAFIGQTSLNFGSGPQLELFFGRDELLRVSVAPERRDGANTGFVSSRTERRVQRSYQLENRHSQAITVQVLEASPVSQHEDIRVQASYSPEPADRNWHAQPGIVAWTLPLAAGQQQTLTADYLISYPKDARVQGLR